MYIWYVLVYLKGCFLYLSIYGGTTACGGKWLGVYSWNCIFLKAIQYPFENMIYDRNFQLFLPL